MLPEFLARWIGELQGWLFQSLVLPLVQYFDLAVYMDDAFNGTEELLLGALEVGLIIAVMAPLQRLIPYEPPASGAELKADVRSDIVYTLIHRLGLVPLALFFSLRPLADGLQAWLHLHGIPTLNLEALVPGLNEHPVAAFVLYAVVIDFVQYWIHRGQHGLGWWWALHALHHSQRRMTYWTDNRVHLLDTLISETLLALVALAIGVQPAQYAAIAIGTRVLESLSHANVRIWYGRLGERLIVSPRYHRQHHAIDASPHGRYRGANYAVLLPLWDIVFGTADFQPHPGPTGVDDQAGGRDYGHGFWRQQWLGLQRFGAALSRARRSA